ALPDAAAGAAAPKRCASAMRRSESPSRRSGGSVAGAGPNQRHPQWASTAASSARAMTSATAEMSLARHGSAGDALSLAYNLASLTSSIATLNPQLALLQPYPFERLRALLAGVAPPLCSRPINLSIGEPQ